MRIELNPYHQHMGTPSEEFERRLIRIWITDDEAIDIEETPGGLTLKSSGPMGYPLVVRPHVSNVVSVLLDTGLQGLD